MQSPNYSPTGEKSWLAPTISHPLAGDVWLPGSKSLTNRELVLSAIQENGYALRYASAELQLDPELQKIAEETKKSYIHAPFLRS